MLRCGIHLGRPLLLCLPICGEASTERQPAVICCLASHEVQGIGVLAAGSVPVPQPCALGCALLRLNGLSLVALLELQTWTTAATSAISYGCTGCQLRSLQCAAYLGSSDTSAACLEAAGKLGTSSVLKYGCAESLGFEALPVLRSRDLIWIALAVWMLCWPATCKLPSLLKPRMQT